MSSEVAVKVSHVGKTFHESQGAGSFKEAFVNIGRKLTGKKEKRLHKGEYTALKDINFEIKKGEFFGIVGRNGCGKSTLLKIIAGVYAPTKGAVHVNGTLTPFIELGVGFNPELSGRDNVFLNGALLGFTRKQMEAMYDDIVEFAELKEFMDMKLKNYSSGMQVRLAFSVAIRADSEILLIDEVLAVGDAAFQQKCFQYFDLLKKKQKTIVFVTHDMNSVRQYCDRAVYLEDGLVISNNIPSKISEIYEEKNFTSAIDQTKKDNTEKSKIKVVLRNEKDQSTTSVKYNSKVKIEISWMSDKKDQDVQNIGVILFKGSEPVFATNTVHLTNKNLINGQKAILNINNKLGNSRYRVYVGLFGDTMNKPLLIDQSALIFESYGAPSVGPKGDEWAGIIYLENNWRY